MIRIDGAGGVMRGKAANDELSGRGGVQRQVHEPRRSQFLEDQDVGIFAEGRTGNRQHLVRPAAHLSLADERSDALVHDVDLALDGDDMVAARAVDQVHEGRHERAFAARPRARNEHKALRFDRQCLNLARQTELIGGYRS